ARLTKNVRCDDAPLVLADVSQLPDAVDVTDRPQPFSGAQARIDFDPLRIRFDADGLQTDPGDARPPAGRDEQTIAAQCSAVVELQEILIAFAPRSDGAHAERELDAVAAQDLRERLSQRPRLAREHMR